MVVRSNQDITGDRTGSSLGARAGGGALPSGRMRDITSELGAGRVGRAQWFAPLSLEHRDHPSVGISAVRYRVPSSRLVGPARPYLTIHMARRSTFRCTARLDTGTWHHLCTPGDVIAVPAGCSATWEAGERELLTIGIAWDSVTRLFEGVESRLLSGMVERASRAPLRTTAVSLLMTRLWEELRAEDNPGTPLLVESMTCTLVSVMLRDEQGTIERCLSERVMSTLTPLQITRVEEYCRSNLRRPIRLTEMAGVAGLSAFHFARQFKRTTGLTPRKYVMRLRVDEATARLRAAGSRADLSQIADACGFADQSHLTRWFRDLKGHTPGAFRDVTSN